MKKIFLILNFVFACTYLLCGQEYRVNVKSSLNARSAPQADAGVLGQLKNNETVFVYDIKNGWAHIKLNNKDAYINSQYLEPVKTTTNETEPPNYSRKKSNPKWVLYIFVALLLLTKFVSKGNGFQPRSSQILLLVLCAAELIYMLAYSYIFKDKDPLWFAHPRRVGFFLGILTSFLLYIFIYVQVSVFLNYIEDVFGDDGAISTGVYLAGLAAFLLGSEFIPYAVVAGLILGIAAAAFQLFLFFRIMFKVSFLDSIVYIVSLGATAVLFRNVPGQIMYLIDYIAY